MEHLISRDITRIVVGANDLTNSAIYFHWISNGKLAFRLLRNFADMPLIVLRKRTRRQLIDTIVSAIQALSHVQPRVQLVEYGIVRRS